MSRAIRWLHLSDLHCGSGGGALRFQVYYELERSMRSMTDQLGPPDLILLSGDVANTGRWSDFEAATSFLQDLLSWLGFSFDDLPRRSDAPVIVPVPGNHDLLRPASDERGRYEILAALEDDGHVDDAAVLSKLWWEDREPSLVEPLFGAYKKWLLEVILPQLVRPSSVSHHISHFPGDLFVRIEPPGAFPLCVVGLNSAWRQVREGDFEHRLSIALEQFHAALPSSESGNPLDVFAGSRQALFLCHHPPSWLSSNAMRVFLETIFTPDRFALCLHGHMHEGRSEGVVISGGRPRYYYQAPALFGLEHYGTRNEARSFGYTWGSIDERGTVRVWPLVRAVVGGEAKFMPDPAFSSDDPKEGVQIRPIRTSETDRFPGPARLEASVRNYLQWLRDGPGRGSGGDWQKDVHTYYVNARGSTEPPPSSETSAPCDELAQVVLAALNERRSVALLGQFGTGKSWFVCACLCRQAEALLERKDAGPIPLLVDLKVFRRPAASILGSVFRRQTSLFDLVRREAWVRAFGESIVRAEELRLVQMFDDDRFLLFFDGLDEMRRSEALELLEELGGVNARTAHSPVLLTCRRDFFRTIAEEKRLSDLGFVLAYVWPWDREQLRRYAVRAHEVGALQATADEVLATVESRYGLQDLATRALLAAMLIHQWNEIEWRDEVSFSMPALYERHVERALSLWQGARAQILTMDQIRRCMEEVADLMFRADTRAVTAEEIDKYVAQRLGVKRFSAVAAELAGDLTSNAFLVRADADQGTKYAFCHASFCDFLVARRILRQVQGRDYSSLGALGRAKQYRTVIDEFLVPMLGPERAKTLVQSMTASTR